MRMSVVSLLEGQHRPYTPFNTQVTLDGEVVSKAFEADEEEGWVDYYVPEEREPHQDFLPVKRAYGEVKFFMSEEPFNEQR